MLSMIPGNTAISTDDNVIYTLMTTTTPHIVAYSRMGTSTSPPLDPQCLALIDMDFRLNPNGGSLLEP